MEKTLYSSLGLVSQKTRVKPGRGLDNGVVSIGRGKVMVLTTDPVSVIPSFGMELSAWLSVHLIASDFTSSGADPEFAVFAYNFPSVMSEAEREEFVRAIGKECEDLGVTIAGGHTGSYPGGGFTVVGSGTMFGLAPDGRYLTPAMARTGDLVLITKSAAIEATGSLALAFPEFVGRKVGTNMMTKARAMIRLCSTVGDARAARKAGLGKGGITSMHDATEGGVLGSLEEMAFASGKTFHINADMIPVSDEAKMVCSVFGLDPLVTMGEGALLITCNPKAIQSLERSMAAARIPLHEIGRVASGRGLRLHGTGETPRRSVSGPDRYWEAYDKGVADGLT